MEESILDYAEGKFSGNIPHPSLNTLLCIKGGVKFNEEEEERCTKASPLSLAGVLKALGESEEGERREKTRKKKKAETKEKPKEPTPIAVSDEVTSCEEKGEYEAYEEQPMLSPTADRRTPALTRAKGRGKQKAETEKSSASELLSLLKEMKAEMKERDE